ncbi:MAG: 50S ribosomal protein L19 [Planctomycetota bacterium]
MDLIRQIELENMKTEVPDFGVGDTVDVHYLIREGEKERVQIFSGTVIRIAGSGPRRNVVVRRLVAGEGVERTFPIHSPRVQTVKIRTPGRIRRARLYYLRDRVGKSVRLAQNFGNLRGPRSLPLATRRNPEQLGGAKKEAAAPSDESTES